MRFYQIDRLREDDPAPVCGRPAGHSGQCVTAEAYRLYLRRQAERNRQLRRGS